MHKCHKGIINYAGEEKKEKISDVIESNYMPYAMSVIMSRAIPEIDGFKPSQRKLLFTMYKMGLLHSPRTKSANIVGQTMKLNPHGDSAIYDTMARMSRGYEALPYPYVDSKGNFGKCYSRDMARAASRYTEAKLENICEEIFKDIEKNTVDFVFNYDNTLKEPTLFPVAYPSILVNSISGIAVGMASSICPFNLKEICETVIKLIKNKDHDIVSTLIAPDFTCGAEVIYDKDIIEEIYKTGRGTIQFRARYLIDSNLNCIDIINIPPTTTCESIIEKVADLIKQNKITEISDIRDETGLNGLKITIDLKKGTDFDRLMFKLFKLTTLQDNFSCNFNILVNGTPRVMSVHQIIFEWIDFRIKSIKRRLTFELGKKEEKLEVLVGLEKILLDVDIAIKIIRETKEESSVVSNLMNHFNLSKIQSEFISELKLKNLNKEYIFKKINEIKNIKDEILKFKKILENESRLKKIICKELEFISKKFGKDRICPIIYKEDIDKKEAKIEYVQDYPITLFFTKEGYIKKISQHSVKLNNDQKLKVGDEISQIVNTTNKCDLLFFTSFCNVYKIKASTFADSKVNTIGDFVCARLGCEKNEKILLMVDTTDYKGFMIFFFIDGTVSKVNLDCYFTNNRKKLMNAYNKDRSLVSCFYIKEDQNFLIFSTSGKILGFNTSLLIVKNKRNHKGTLVMKQGKYSVNKIEICKNITSKYFTKNIPSSGKKISNE